MGYLFVNTVNDSCKSKICDFYDAFMHEEVRWFDISVDNVFLMDFFETVTGLSKDVNGFELTQFSTFAFHIGLEILLTIF